MVVVRGCLCCNSALNEGKLMQSLFTMFTERLCLHILFPLPAFSEQTYE